MMWNCHIYLSIVGVCFLQCIPLSLGAVIDYSTSDVTGLSVASGVLLACITVVILVFVVSLCGGCTPMEVGSEDHAATGSIKRGGSSGHYDSVATDANTRVLTAATTLPDDPYQHQDNSILPYSLHPAGPTTAHTFTGYTPIQQPGGYGQSGMGGQASHGYQGAHRPAFNTESPPPNYAEAIQPNAPPAQPYGW